MPCWEGKKYKLESSENFDEYMKAIGVNFFTRKLGNSISPTIELLKNEDDTYTFHTTSTFKNTTIIFKPGEEFEEETIDGRKVKSVCIFEGENKLVHEQKGEHPTTMVREFKEDEMSMTMTLGDLVCTRLYKVV